MRIPTKMVFIAMCMWIIAAHADGLCDAALVKSTYQSFSVDHLDWRLALLVTEMEYDQIKHDAGVNAVIYGVPVGASYSDFEQRVHQMQTQFGESLTHDQAINILWTGLDPNAVTAYSDCLKAQVLSATGLHLTVHSASKTDIAVIATWTPKGQLPSNIAPTWAWKSSGTIAFPKSLQAGDTTLVLDRPSQQQNLAVNYKGFSDSLVLSPLPPIPPPPPPKPLVVTSIVNATGDMPSGSCDGYSPWYQLCSDNQPPDWTIVADSFQLTGNRSCTSGWAECRKTVSTSARICYSFRMQGHAEECGHSGNTGIQYSKGSLTTTWQHPQVDAAGKTTLPLNLFVPQNLPISETIPDTRK